MSIHSGNRIDSAIPFPGIYPPNWNYVHKNLYMDAQRSIIHDSQNLETTQMFTNW
jgi:hypothetical protein